MTTRPALWRRTLAALTRQAIVPPTVWSDDDDWYCYLAEWEALLDHLPDNPHQKGKLT